MPSRYIELLISAIDALDEELKNDLLQEICLHLWPDGDADTSWTPDTIDEIGQILVRAGLHPDQIE